MSSAQGWPAGTLAEPRFERTSHVNREKQRELRPRVTWGIDMPHPEEPVLQSQFEQQNHII